MVTVMMVVGTIVVDPAGTVPVGMAAVDVELAEMTPEPQEVGNVEGYDTGVDETVIVVGKVNKDVKRVTGTISSGLKPGSEGYLRVVEVVSIEVVLIEKIPVPVILGRVVAETPVLISPTLTLSIKVSYQ